MHARHILMKTNELQDDATVKQKLNDIRERILKGEDFAGLAQISSEDPGSAAEGGDLGWTGPGTFVPEFEQMLASLKDNEISEPFHTQYGWHIVQLLGPPQVRQHRRAEAPAGRSKRSAPARPTKRPSCGCAACAMKPTSNPKS